MTTSNRQSRAAETRAAALVREALGQAAGYARLDDGRHLVRFYHQARGRLFEVRGSTIEEAIELARAEVAP